MENYDDYDEIDPLESEYCPYCRGQGYRHMDGWPVHCTCGAVCPHDCPACMVGHDDYRQVRVFGPFWRFWSQHEGLHAHGFYYNGRRAMYVLGVSFRPFHMYGGKAS